MGSTVSRCRVWAFKALRAWLKCLGHVKGVSRGRGEIVLGLCGVHLHDFEPRKKGYAGAGIIGEGPLDTGLKWPRACLGQWEKKSGADIHWRGNVFRDDLLCTNRNAHACNKRPEPQNIQCPSAKMPASNQVQLPDAPPPDSIPARRDPYLGGQVVEMNDEEAQ
nr:hypothetical protein Iba_chr06dCG0380 [Ipomoea batatas]